MEKYSIKKYGGDTSEILNTSFQALIDSLSGIIKSDKKNFRLTVSHLLQALVRGKFMDQLHREWDDYSKKGKIKDDYQSTDQHFECLQEMLDFLDNDNPDQTRFNVVKKIFLKAACEDKSDRNSIIPQQFMRICRKLTSGELIVLSTTYKVLQTKPKEIGSASEWLKIIAMESNLKHASLVEVHEETLVEKHLLDHRLLPNRSGVNTKPHFRLTDLGLAICEFIEEFELTDSAKETD